MKLPEFKEQQGTSMASAMMTPAQRPNIKPHQAAIQRFYPKEDPNDYIRLANAEANQYNAIAKGVGSVATAFGRIYEANDNANANAATAYVKRGMAEFVTNAKRNTLYEVTDQVTGQTVRPWDSMDQTFDEHMEMLKEEARQKYGFSMKQNQLKFDTDTDAYKTSGNVDLSTHGWKLKNDDTRAKALEDIGSTDTIDDLTLKIGKYKRDGTFGHVEAYKLENSKGGAILSTEYMNMFIGSTNLQIREIEDAIRNDPRAKRYLEPDELEKSLANWKNDAAKDGVLRILDGAVAQHGEYSFQEQMAVVDRMLSIPLEDSGFATEQDRYTAMYTLGSRIESAQSAYLKQFGLSKSDTNVMSQMQKFFAYGGGDVTEGNLNRFLELTVQPQIDTLMSTGQNVDPDQYVRNHIKTTPLVNSPVLPEDKANLFRNASVNPQLLGLTYKDWANWAETMPTAMGEFNAKHPELKELHLLLGSPTEAQRAGISNEAIQNAIDTMTVGSTNPEIRKANQKRWNDKKDLDDELQERTQDRVLQEMGLEGIDLDESPDFMLEMNDIMYEKSAISYDPEFIAKATANVMRYYSVREEQGRLVAVKGDALAHYKNRHGIASPQQEEMLRRNLSVQERRFAESLGYGEEYDDGNIIFRPTGLGTNELNTVNPTAYMLLVKDGVTTVIGDPYNAHAKAMVYSDPTTALVDGEAQYAVKTSSQLQTRKEIVSVLTQYGDGKTELSDYELSFLPDDMNTHVANFFGLNLFDAGTKMFLNSENSTAFRMYGAINTAIDKMAVARNLTPQQVDVLRQHAALYMQVEHGMDTEAFTEAMSKGFDPRKDKYVMPLPEEMEGMNVSP